LLPDYTKAKQELHKLVVDSLEQGVRHYRGFPALKEYRIFEGRSSSTLTEDGTSLKSTPKEFSGRCTIKMEDIQSPDPGRIWEHVDKMAREIAELETREFYAKVGETCDQTGQTHDFGGKPLSAEMFFKALESIFIEFDDDGKFRNLAFITAPHMADRFMALTSEIDTDPELKRQYDELISRKWAQWRDREASRKLVG